MREKSKIVLPAEWDLQSAVQLTWPHENTDWNPILEEVTACFVDIAKEIVKREKLLIVCKDEQKVKSQLSEIDFERVIFREIETNDTWARDHGAISVFIDEEPFVYDFAFNGWGMKFDADLDNRVTKRLYAMNAFCPKTGYMNMLHYVLEGGSIESDGKGTIMTTSNCLLSKNRNSHLTKEEIEKFLKTVFGAHRILWLNSGYLFGDDTDSHIDTLARFCDEETIAYVRCEDSEDEHYESLLAMEEELKDFRTATGKPYRLIPLPMASPVVIKGKRHPATYANFLIVNGAVLMPTYNSLKKDTKAKQQLQKAFPDREIIGINCLPLIRQNGSLHCATMHFPLHVID